MKTHSNSANFARSPRNHGAKRAIHRAKQGLIAAASVFIVANLALGFAAEWNLAIRDPMYGDKVAKLRARFAPETTPRVLMMGTSRTGLAFHGQHVEATVAATGRAIGAFNFGIPASGPITHLLYTQRLARANLLPHLMLIEILPSSYADRAEQCMEAQFLKGDRLTWSEQAQAIAHGLPASVADDWRLATFVPWYGLRFQLLGRFIRSWIPWQYRHDWSRGTDAWGWSTPTRQTATAHERETLTNNARREYAPILRDWQPNADATAALWELMQLCREHGITVKLILMPEGTAFQSWYPPTVNQRLDRWLATVRAEFQCEIISARDWLPDDEMYDSHHVFQAGAIRFSNRLCDEVILPWLRGHE